MRQVARRLQSLNNRVFNRISGDAIREALVRLGLAPGDTIFANISLRSLGYVTGGPATVVRAILEVLGEGGTLMMAAWPANHPARVDPSSPFDVSETPSMAGRCSEALRRQPGAIRSLHPVASAVALGARAAELTAHHDLAVTPFGQHSPYGRLARFGPKLLLVGTHLGGLLHHVQDRVGFPNLYAAEPVSFEVSDQKRERRPISTLVLRPEVPPVVILPGSRPENRDYLLVADYALMFPPQRERLVMETGYLRFNRSRFLGKRDRLQARGILRTGRVGSAEAALLDGQKLIDQVAKDLAWDLARFKEEYDPEQLARLSLPLI